MSTDKLVTAETMAAAKPKKATGPRDPRMVRIGGVIAIAGFIPAIVCAAILGAQPGGSNPIVEWLHRGALFIILAGFLVILFGVIRFEKINARLMATSQRVPVQSTIGVRLIIGFVGSLILVTSLLLAIAAIGLQFFAVAGFLSIPAPMIMLAIYGPAQSRPFFVAALFPALILLAVDCELLLFLVLNGFDNLYFSSAHRIVNLALMHMCGVIAMPLFGLAGQRFVNWLRTLDDTPTP